MSAVGSLDSQDVSRSGNHDHTNCETLTIMQSSDKSVAERKENGVCDVPIKETDSDSDAMTTQPEKQGLMNAHAMAILLLWYFFSAVTLFLNKYIMIWLKADAVFFGKLMVKDMVKVKSWAFFIFLATEYCYYQIKGYLDC